MTPIDEPNASTMTEPCATGWIVSLLLHGTLALGTFVFLQQIRLTPPTIPFSWNVTMVAPTIPTDVTPATSQQSARAAEPSTNPRPAKTERASQPEELLTQDVAARIPAPAPRPIEEYNLPRSIDPSPLSRATEPMEQDSRHQDLATHALAPSAPSPPSSSPSVESPASAHEYAVAVPQETPLPQETTTSTEPQVAALTPAGQAKSAKVDYGWLADLMAKWIGELDKRYPAMLRTEGVSGRVTLTAVLHHNGALSDVRVAKSSGNAQLDQIAVEDIQNGPPVRLPRPLDRPSIPVKFSIVYDLKTAR